MQIPAILYRFPAYICKTFFTIDDGRSAPPGNNVLKVRICPFTWGTAPPLSTTQEKSSQEDRVSAVTNMPFDMDNSMS